MKLTHTEIKFMNLVWKHEPICSTQLVKLCNEQFSIIKSQKFNIENIDKLILEISDCEGKLDELEKANNRSEIVDLLKEFSVESPEIEKVELPDERQVFEEVEKSIEKNT